MAIELLMTFEGTEPYELLLMYIVYNAKLFFRNHKKLPASLPTRHCSKFHIRIILHCRMMYMLDYA